MNGFFDLFEDKRRRENNEQARKIQEAVVNGNFTVINLPPRNGRSTKQCKKQWTMGITRSLMHR